MDNKKDWEKLEKWEENEKMKKIKKYNFDIDSFYKKKEEKNARRLEVFTKTKTIFILVMAVFIMVAFTYYKIESSNFKPKIDSIITLLYSNIIEK